MGGFLPLDMEPGDQLSTGAMLFSGGCTLAAVGIAIIYWENGLTAVVAIIAYTMTLSCMSLSITNVCSEPLCLSLVRDVL